MLNRVTASCSIVEVVLLFGMVIQLHGLSLSIRQHNIDSITVTNRLIDNIQQMQSESISKIQEDVRKQNEWIQKHQQDQAKYRLQVERFEQLRTKP